MNEEEYLKKKKYYEDKINIEVEKLKVLLDNGNMMYIDLSQIVSTIETLKHNLTSLRGKYEVEYMYED